MTTLAMPPRTITVAGLEIPETRTAIAAEHASDLETLKSWALASPPTNEEELAATDACLTSAVQLKDDLVARRQAPVKQIKAVISDWESCFRAYLKDVEVAEEGLKTAIGSYRLAQREAAAQAHRDAQAAAAVGDSPAVLAAVQKAGALANPDDARATTRYAWEVKRINQDLLPDEWWCPDVAKIAALAKASKADDKPVIPGVVFELGAIVGGRR